MKEQNEKNGLAAANNFMHKVYCEWDIEPKNVDRRVRKRQIWIINNWYMNYLA
jgi:hypothetical protein